MANNQSHKTWVVRRRVDTWGLQKTLQWSFQPVCRSDPVQRIRHQSAGPIRFRGSIQETSMCFPDTMLSIRVSQMFLLLGLLCLAASLPVRDTDEDFPTQKHHLDASWSLPGISQDPLPETTHRRFWSAGLHHRRQLGDIEFSNRYAEFLRSKAKHSSVCASLRRSQGVRKSGVGGDTERVNLLLKQYMCPSVYSWPSDL